MSYEPKPDAAPAYEANNAAAHEHNPSNIQYQQQQPYSQEPKPNYMPGQQPQPQAQQYQTSVALHSLQGGPAPVDCPACRQRALTKVEFESGNTTNAWAGILCIFTCLGCIPFCIDSTKDVVHSCGKCGARLACWHRSGHTEVLMHA